MYMHSKNIQLLGCSKLFTHMILLKSNVALAGSLHESIDSCLIEIRTCMLENTSVLAAFEDTSDTQLLIEQTM